MIAIVEGATSAQGAVTGKHYRIPAGETRTLDVPEGELQTFPDNRIVEVRRGPDRSWKGDGSWKTLYEDGDEVAKVQCSADDAEAWADGDLDLSDLQ